MAKSRYQIKIANWEKHQKKLKAGHTHFMLSKRFFDDEKVSLLKQNECLLFINLLAIAADLMSNSFTINTKLLPNMLRIGDKSLHNCLERLQSFQLLSYEKVSPNIIEKNIKEDKIKEDTTNLEKKNLATRPASNKSDAKNMKANNFIKKYCDLFKQKYGTNPEILNKDAGIAKRLASEFSEEKQGLYLEAFFSMPDAWLMKNKHPLNLFEVKKNEIVVFANSGKFTTQQQAQQLDKSVDFAEKLNAIREGKA